MPVKVRVQAKGPYLKLLFFAIMKLRDEMTLREFNVDDLALVRFKFLSTVLGKLESSFSVKKNELAKNYTVKMNIACSNYSRQLVCTEDWTDWLIVGQRDCDVQMSKSNDPVYALEMTITVSKLNPITFPQLYDETEFCDFHLSAADGSGRVAVHKVCLISHSDMFKRMLLTKWKETEEDCIQIKDVTVQTLQHLKDYIYLGTLPDDGLCPLLLLAKLYLMENLKEECIMKLALTVKPEDLYSLQEFAADNKLYELIRAIVQLTPDETVQKAHKIKSKEQQNESNNEGNKSTVPIVVVKPF